MKAKKSVKQVRETRAGKSISAYLVLDAQNREVATVHVYHTIVSTGHQKWVDVFQPRSKDHAFQQGKGRSIDDALHDFVIDNVRLYRECMPNEECQQFLAKYRRSGIVGSVAQNRIVKQAEALGMQWASPTAEKGYTSLYYEPGLKRLEKMGYRVIQVF